MSTEPVRFFKYLNLSVQVKRSPERFHPGGQSLNDLEREIKDHSAHPSEKCKYFVRFGVWAHTYRRMQPMYDSALLRQYVENHSEDAFAALVTRHINLVYSVALRHVGDAHHVKEITKAVFIILAKKALQLRHDRAVSNWLFQATRLTANNFVRSKARRRRHEQGAHTQSVLNESGSDVWQRIAPLLDEAVAALDHKDRRAVMLRLYEGRNLGDIVSALRVNEEAARERINRALDKLRRFFARRGVDSTAATLAQTISINSVQAAPVALAKSVTAAAVGAAASTSTLTLVKDVLKTMARTKAKTSRSCRRRAVKLSYFITIIRLDSDETTYKWEGA